MIKEYDFIVVGGGLAGMTAAGRAAERGRRVLLLERGPDPGRKLLLAGGGRCNLTNTAPLRAHIQAFGRKGEFLRPALSRFGPPEFRAWLKERGVETVVEAEGRVYPASQDAGTVLQALKNHLRENRVELRLNERVRSLRMEGGRLRGVGTDGGTVSGPAVLIATGGLSYPETGSTGDGYHFARQAGHTVTRLFAAIGALETAEEWSRSIPGTPLAEVKMVARHSGQRLGETFGEILWTHYGISGPAVLEISRAVVPALSAGGEVALELDLLPRHPPEELNEILLRAREREGKKHIASVVSRWMPRRMAEVLLGLAGIDRSQPVNQCSKAERRRVVSLTKRLALRITAPRPLEEAIVTGGGVALSEVDGRTMASRLCPGLFFAGEVLDLAGPCGGFNLQASFSTGRLTGDSV